MKINIDKIIPIIDEQMDKEFEIKMRLQIYNEDIQTLRDRQMNLTIEYKKLLDFLAFNHEKVYNEYISKLKPVN